MMPHVEEVICCPGLTGFFFDDQRAIKGGAPGDGFLYQGDPQTPGFKAIRQAGECISLLLRLSDGQWAGGDCCTIQYPGAGGRDGIFRAETYLPLVEGVVAPLLRSRTADAFRPTAELLDGLRHGNRPLHTAIRYGATQAWLDAVARATHLLPCQVLAQEYGLELQAEPVRIFAQSGDDRYGNVDKMILKQVDVLPHGLINNIPHKLGRDGGRLLEYVRWIRQRILSTRPSPDYHPELHIDVYGTIGLIFRDDIPAMASYLARLGQAAEPFPLRIEGPVDMGERLLQYRTLRALRRRLRAEEIPVEIVADEWCNGMDDIRSLAELEAVDMVQIKTPVLGGLTNAVEAVRYCREHGMKAYLGGSCNETEVSARLSVHLALATRPHQMLAKPGMGMDEGLMLVTNEMRRALAVLRAQAVPGQDAGPEPRAAAVVDDAAAVVDDAAAAGRRPGRVGTEL